MICSCPAGGHTGPPLQLSTNVSVIVQNVAKTAKLPPQSAKADSSPIAYAMGEPLKAVH